MEISVIIPTVAPGDYLFECLDCIQNQSLDKEQFEVLIVLNGERLPYYDNIHRYISGSGLLNWRLLHTEIAGVSNARNIGLDKAIGEGIVFIDDDDIVSSCFLEELLRMKSEKAIVVAQLKTFVSDIRVMGNDYLAPAYEKIRSKKRCSVLRARKFFSNACGKYIPLNVIGEVRFDPKMWIDEDAVFMAEIAKNVSFVEASSPNSIYFRRIREQSASRRKCGLDEMLVSALYAARKYTSFYVASPSRYSFLFILSRVFASPKALTINALKRWLPFAREKSS